MFKAIFSSENYLCVANGMLQQFEINSVTFDGEDKVKEYCVTLEDGTKEVFDNSVKFYKTEEDFKNGIEYTDTRDFYCGNNLTACDNGGFLVHYWDMVNGEPTQLSAEIPTVTFNIEGTHYSHVLNGAVKLPNRLYGTRTECLDHSEYKFIIDGEVVTRTGIAKLAELTDEQKEAVKAFSEACQKVKELGVEMYCESERQNIYFINGKSLDLYASWEGCKSDDGYKELDMQYCHFEDFPFYYLYSEDFVYCKEKK